MRLFNAQLVGVVKTQNRDSINSPTKGGFMNEQDLEILAEKKRQTKQAIEELKNDSARRKLEARRKIEDLKMMKEMGL